MPKISFMPMCWNITAFGHFRQTSDGRKLTKTHLHTKTFHLNLFTCLYDHMLQRYSLGKLMFRKTAVLGSYGNIRPTSGNRMWPNCQKAYLHAKTIIRSHVDTTIRYRETAWKRSCFEKPLFLVILANFDTKIQPGKESMTDGRLDGRSDTPN